MDWTEDDDAELCRMRDNGSSWESVAEELDRPIGQCQQRLKEIAPTHPAASKGQTSEDLRGALFLAMDKLLKGQMEPDQAKAICQVSSSICDTVRMEMEARRLQESLGGAQPNRHLKLSKD